MTHVTGTRRFLLEPLAHSFGSKTTIQNNVCPMDLAVAPVAGCGNPGGRNLPGGS